MHKKTSYNHLPYNVQKELKVSGRNIETGVDTHELVDKKIPIDKIEQSYMRSCDTMAGIFDGTLDEDSEHYMDGKARYGGGVDHAVYLDKSARPVHFLMRKTWDLLSDGKMPGASYRNIDKGNWRQLMLAGTKNVDQPDVEAISFDNVDTPEEQAKLREHIARLRATYISRSDLEKIDETNFVEEVWQYPTILDGKKVAVVDEVKSSGATLKIADMLLREAIPEAKFEPVYWSVPGMVRWTRYDKEGNEIGEEFAAKTVPVWYDRDSNLGRGIRDMDVMEASESDFKKHRLGAYVLSRPFTIEHPMDWKSIEMREDLATLAERFRQGEVDYMPGGDRDLSEYYERIERYHGEPYKEWLKRRRDRRAA